MILGAHYYVLSLSTGETALYEAFRDTLIPVEDQGFPVAPTTRGVRGGARDAIRSSMRTVDERFDHYDSSARLGLVVVGDEDLRSAFDAVTTHGSSVVGYVKGDRSGARATDLGQMVWPVVKEVISAVRERSARELAESSRDGQAVAGLHAVAAAAATGARGTLLVEEGFRVRGSLVRVPDGPVISADVDIRDLDDDAVDAVIACVLEHGGNVVFMDDGTLAREGRIALLRREG